MLWKRESDVRWGSGVGFLVQKVTDLLEIWIVGGVAFYGMVRFLAKRMAAEFWEMESGRSFRGAGWLSGIGVTRVRGCWEGAGYVLQSRAHAVQGAV